MKIRNGFVSNSSSSSFMISGYGVSIQNIEELKDGTYKLLSLDDFDGDEDAMYDYTSENNGCEYDLCGSGLSLIKGEGYGYYLMLDPLRNMGEDETLQQFKSRIQENVNAILKQPKEIRRYQDSWEVYD